MDVFPASRFFRLSDEGVCCDQDGLFVAGAPMLVRSPRPGGEHVWAMRPTNDQNRDLSARYGFQIDIATKRHGVERVAQALNRSDVALAQISAPLLRFPDPPALSKRGHAYDESELERQLVESGLLKADWHPAKHPRTGEPPYAGWFAPKEDAPVDAGGAGPTLEEAAPLVPKGSEVGRPPDKRLEIGPTTESASATQPKSGLSPREILRDLRSLLKAETLPLVQSGVVIDWAVEKLSIAIAQAVANLQAVTATSPPAVYQTVLRALNEALAAQNPPKSLAQLQTPPTQHAAGYDAHHLVQQNPVNIEKAPIVRFERFGWNVIDAPSNIVWIPRVKHRLITDYYNMTDPSDSNGRHRRDVVSDMDYDEQYANALSTLTLFGVLQ
jgi:hypothetical protein